MNEDIYYSLNDLASCLSYQTETASKILEILNRQPYTETNKQKINLVLESLVTNFSEFNSSVVEAFRYKTNIIDLVYEDETQTVDPDQLVTCIYDLDELDKEFNDITEEDDED
jgi:hypothetical protein